MPAIDTYENFGTGLSSPLTSAAEVTPSNSADLSHVSRALFVGVGGDLRVVMASGETVTFGGLPGGWHPLRVRRVLSTGTTADAVVACW